MNVLYSCDNNYVWLMGISMVSLFENNKELQKLTVYLLGDNISADNKNVLEHIGNLYNRECIVIDVTEFNIPDSLCSQRWPVSAYTRLYAGALLPASVNKILYLDCDTIIKGKIGNIEDYLNNEYAVYGVKDCISKEYRKNIGIKSDSVYINAGVLFLNLDKFREYNIPVLIDDFLVKFNSTMYYADQDVLNGIFKGKVGVLPPTYNLMTLICTHTYQDLIKIRKPSNYYKEFELVDAVKNPVIIHYTTCMLTIRPWYSNSNHPFLVEFLKYFKLSPWKNHKFAKYENKINKKDTVLKIFYKFPRGLRNSLLGLVHASIFPLIIRVKSK